MYKLHTQITINQAIRAGSEVVKQSEHPKMSSLMYPALQALNEQYLGVDSFLGGIYQIKINTRSFKYFAKIMI